MLIPLSLSLDAPGEIVVAESSAIVPGLGDIVFLELPNLNDNFNQNDIFGTIEAVKTLADLYIPISGSIMEINDKLESEPELINSDPYGEGWIIKIKISDSSEVDALLSDNDYKSLIG
mgnify:CR=1 FL=1